jgi:hypothetical protein
MSDRIRYLGTSVFDWMVEEYAFIFSMGSKEFYARPEHCGLPWLKEAVYLDTDKAALKEAEASDGDADAE